MATALSASALFFSKVSNFPVALFIVPPPSNNDARWETGGRAQGPAPTLGLGVIRFTWGRPSAVARAPCGTHDDPVVLRPGGHGGPPLLIA